MAKYKRKRYFIERRLQTKYIILTIMLLSIYTVLFVGILLFPYIVALSFDYPIAEQAEASKTLLVLHSNIWPALGTVMLIMSLGSIIFTHRMAGPVYRFKKVLAEVSAGNLDLSIQLREKDDFKDLAESVNTVLEELRTFAHALRTGDETLSVCIDELKDDNLSKDARDVLIEKMLSSRADISQVLGKYSK